MRDNSAAERTIRGLLRLIGWSSGRDRELTEEEAGCVLDIATEEPVSDDVRARLREEVLRRRFGTP